jgi:hypothetical protein
MNLTFATLQKKTDVQQEDQDQGIAFTGTRQPGGNCHGVGANFSQQPVYRTQ